MSHSLSVWSPLKPMLPPVSRRVPSGENATELTKLVCASKVRIGCPLEASHKLIVLALADSRRVPSGEIATDRIGERWLSVWITCPLSASHSLKVRSSLPDNRRVPSGENATDRSQWACPTKVRTSRPLAASHSLRVRSPPPDSKRVPSGEKATDWTEPEVPAKVRSSWPLAASHNLSVQSPPVIRCLPFGRNATTSTGSSCPANVCSS